MVEELQTFGTQIHTLRSWKCGYAKINSGKKDHQNKDEFVTRSVTYHGRSQTRLQFLREWHSWLHKIIKTTPDQNKFQ